MRLTDRENEVLEQVASGYSNAMIADQLCLSIHTVRSHLDSIYRKLNVANRAEAVSVKLHLTMRCDFSCNKDEKLLLLQNQNTLNQWRCHLSCLREYMNQQEKLI